MHAIDNLKKFGLEFQIKCISGLISDKPFMERINDIVDPTSFEIEAHQWIIKQALDYFIEYKELPTITIFKLQIDAIENASMKASIEEQLKIVYKKITDSDLKYIKEQFLEFCKNQKLKSAILDSVEHLKRGGYEKIKTTIDNALKAGMERNIGHDYMNDVSARMVESTRAVIPTGWQDMDAILDGGLGAGELGVVTACAGSGKCVGPNTEIEIKYNEFGIEIVGNSGDPYILWINPLEKYTIDDKSLFGWQVENVMFELEKAKNNTKNNSKKLLVKPAYRPILIGHLFSKLEIKNEENAVLHIPFPLQVLTPHGYKKIVTAFRTENQETVTSYFENGKTLKTSNKHRLKVDGNWKHVEDITVDTEVECQSGITRLVEKKEGSSKEILYDISVEDVHCYYSNGIISHNSWLLTKLGAEAMKNGKNVLHVTLELNEKYVGKRYDSCFTGIDFQNIRNNADLVQEKLKSIPGKLIIKYFPIKTVSAYNVKLHLERIQTLGTKIDLLIVDYADILRPFESDRGSNSYNEAGGIYEELRGVAGELQVPVWTASQCGRSGMDDDILTAKSIADSYRKIMTADFVMSLSRKTQDKVANTARIHIIKNRFGPDGMTYPTRMNASCGDIQIFNEDSREGSALVGQMSNNENLVKKQLLSKWNSHLESQEEIE